MRSTVVVHFGPSDDVTLYLDGPAMAADEARAWLDEQFVHEDCEPLRASGKVLIADKVLALAQTVGRSRFDGDAAWAQAFARAASAALAKPTVRVDLVALALTF
jgi:hypothetical protein